MILIAIKCLLRSKIVQFCLKSVKDIYCMKESNYILHVNVLKIWTNSEQYRKLKRKKKCDLFAFYSFSRFQRISDFTQTNKLKAKFYHF